MEEDLKKYFLDYSIIALIFKDNSEIKILSKINIKDKKVIKSNSFKNIDLKNKENLEFLIENSKIIYEDFWKDYNFNVLIIDGSKKRLKLKKNYKNIKYFHKNEFQYYKRVFYIVKKAKTDYIKLESDDDYFSPEALTKSINFLDKYRSFSAVTGKCGIYSSFRKEVFINSIFNNHKSLLQKDSYKRLKEYFSNYSPALFYSVMRREVFENNIKVLKKSIIYYGSEYEKFSEILFFLNNYLQELFLPINNLRLLYM